MSIIKLMKHLWSRVCYPFLLPSMITFWFHRVATTGKNSIKFVVLHGGNHLHITGEGHPWTFCCWREHLRRTNVQCEQRCSFQTRVSSSEQIKSPLSSFCTSHNQDCPGLCREAKGQGRSLGDQDGTMASEPPIKSCRRAGTIQLFA